MYIKRAFVEKIIVKRVPCGFSRVTTRTRVEYFRPYLSYIKQSYVFRSRPVSETILWPYKKHVLHEYSLIYIYTPIIYNIFDEKAQNVMREILPSYSRPHFIYVLVSTRTI